MMRVYFCCRELPEKVSQHALAYSVLEKKAAEHFPECAAEKPVYDRKKRGKPFRRDCPGLQFNISHCRRGIAVALGRLPVGVDMERRFAWKEKLAERICQEQEFLWLLSLPEGPVRESYFNRVWSRKEAYLKCTGSGFCRDPREFSVIEKVSVCGQAGAPADEAKGIFADGRQNEAGRQKETDRQRHPQAEGEKAREESPVKGKPSMKKEKPDAPYGEDARDKKNEAQVRQVNLVIDGDRYFFFELQCPEFTLVSCSQDSHLECFEQVFEEDLF